jgi:hypothetical protein
VRSASCTSGHNEAPSPCGATAWRRKGAASGGWCVQRVRVQASNRNRHSRWRSEWSGGGVEGSGQMRELRSIMVEEQPAGRRDATRRLSARRLTSRRPSGLRSLRQQERQHLLWVEVSDLEQRVGRTGSWQSTRRGSSGQMLRPDSEEGLGWGRAIEGEMRPEVAVPGEDEIEPALHVARHERGRPSKRPVSFSVRQSRSMIAIDPVLPMAP